LNLAQDEAIAGDLKLMGLHRLRVQGVYPPCFNNKRTHEPLERTRIQIAMRDGFFVNNAWLRAACVVGICLFS